ncbi:unnamed protein product [Closterium sp. NIES-64]|nr:unnamed protein product [Closterium sp. NIES-64]
MTPMTRFKRSACALLQSLPSPPLTAPHLPSPLFTPPHPSQDCCDGSDEYDGRVGHLPQHVCPGRGGKAAAAGSTPLFPPPPLAPSHPSTDCCDGSDEYDGRITCPNTCAQAGAARRQQLAADVAKHREGVRQRQRAVEEWREKKVRLQEERRERQREKKVRLQEERGRLEEEERELQEKEKALKGMSGCVLVRMCMGVRQRQRAVEEWREKKVRLQEERGRLEEEERELQEKEKVLKGRLEEEERELQEKEKALKGMSGCVLVRMCMGVRQRQRAVEEWREKKVRLQEERGRLEEERELQEKEKVLKERKEALEKIEEKEREMQIEEYADRGSGKEMDDDESDEDLSGLSKEELGRRIASRWAHGEDGPGGAEVEGGDGDGGKADGEGEGEGDDGVDLGGEDGLGYDDGDDDKDYEDMEHDAHGDDHDEDDHDGDDGDNDHDHGHEDHADDDALEDAEDFAAHTEHEDDDPWRHESAPAPPPSLWDKAKQVWTRVSALVSTKPSLPVNETDLLTIRSEYNVISTKLSKTKGRLRTVKENLEKDLGPDGEFASFADHCFSFKVNQYEYEVCPYRQVKQKEKHHSDTTVGRWSGFEDNYRTMMFKNGDKCWNGPNRSIKVKLECGLKTGIKSVEEPSRCEYEAVLVTTAVCNAELAQELERQLKQMEDDLAGHDELVESGGGGRKGAERGGVGWRGVKRAHLRGSLKKALKKSRVAGASSCRTQSPTPAYLELQLLVKFGWESAEQQRGQWHSGELRMNHGRSSTKAQVLLRGKRERAAHRDVGPLLVDLLTIRSEYNVISTKLSKTKGRLRTVKENLEKDLGPDGEFASFADHCFSFKLVSHLTIHHVALDPLLPFPPSSIHLLFPSLLSHTLLPFPSFPNPPPIPLLPKPPSHSPPSQTPLPFPSFPNPPPLSPPSQTPLPFPPPLPPSPSPLSFPSFPNPPLLPPSPKTPALPLPPPHPPPLVPLNPRYEYEYEKVKQMDGGSPPVCSDTSSTPVLAPTVELPVCYAVLRGAQSCYSC